MASDEEMEEETFIDRWDQSSSSEKADLVLELIKEIDESPLVGWKLWYKVENYFKIGGLDAASCRRIAHCILPTLKLLHGRDVSSQTCDYEETIVFTGIRLFLSEFMASVCLNEGPDVVFNCLNYLYKRSPRSAQHIELTAALQNTIVDYYIAIPDSKPPSQSDKIVNFWYDAVVYALETSRFDASSKQVITLCHSIADTLFGGAKLSSAVKKLNDFTGKIDETRSDFPYMFDIEIAKLVKRLSGEQGALIAYSFLWAVLKAFALRMNNEQDYLSVLMLLVHLLQASGAPIKCMATPSLLEYPQADLDENERLFHVVKLLEVYIASELYHPSVLVGGRKRFKGKLIFNDILVYLLKHEAKGTTDWYKGLLHLAKISASVVVPKLRMILQVAWFDCRSEDFEAQDEFLLFLIDMYDRMHKAADLYTRFLGAINDYLVKENDNPRLSEKVLQRMRISFANLGPDDTVRIWSEYIKYLLQVLEKWKDSGAEVSSMPHIFTLNIFAEFIQHCPLVPQVQLSNEQHQKMDSAIQDTLILTAKLEKIMEALPKNSKQFLPHYLCVMQKFIKTRFIRSYYFEDAFREGFVEAAQRQQDLVEQVDRNLKNIKKDKMLRLDILCHSIKFSDDPKETANRCLKEICENFDTIDWHLLIHHHPQVLTSASKKNVDIFVSLLFDYVKEHSECLYVTSQTFRDSSKQVLTFVRLIVRDLLSVLTNFNCEFENILDIEDLSSSVKWLELRKLLAKSKLRADFTEAVSNAERMFCFVPVHCLPPLIRLKILGIMLAVALIQSNPTDEFFVSCFHFLEDLSSALKFKHENVDEDSVLLCRLATLCLDRVLSVDPFLTTKRLSVKKSIDFIRYILFVTAKRTESSAPFEAIIEKLSLRNDANFCTVLLLVETVTRVHSKNISSEEISIIRSKCQVLVNKGFSKSFSRLENFVFVANKYTEVYGIHQALEVQCIAAALKTASRSVLSLKPDVPAFELCVHASEVEDVIPPAALVYCAILVGEEYLDELVKHLNPQLTEKILPVIETIFDDLGELLAFAEHLAAEVGGSFNRSPFSFRFANCSVTTSTVFERCLELILPLVKHMNEGAVTVVVTHVYHLIAVRAFLPNLRLDLCCSILDAATRKHTCPELFFPVYSALGSVPLENLIKAPVDQWCTIMNVTTNMFCRTFLMKPNYTNGVAQILLGATGRLIEAIITRCDRQYVTDDISHVAKIINVIDKFNRVLFMLHRMKAKDRTKTLESCGPLLIASYLQSIVKASIDERFRMDLKSMAFLLLGLCTSKGLFALKLESSLVVQESLRRLVEEYKVKCNVRRF